MYYAKINFGMGNVLRRNKYQKGITNWTLDTDQVQTELIFNLCDKFKIWYHHQNSEQPPRWIVYIWTHIRTRIRLSQIHMVLATHIFYHQNIFVSFRYVTKKAEQEEENSSNLLQ